MIFKLIRRNIVGKPFRFLLTCSAATLGVMFTVGTFVFTDGLKSTFADLVENIVSNTEYAVRPQLEFGDRDLLGVPLDDDLVATLNSIDGVAAVQPQVFNFGAIPVDGDGTARVPNGAPNFGANYPDQSSVPFVRMQVGRPPTGPGEFVLDTDSFEAGNFAVGETYTVINPAGPGSFELVGHFFYASDQENLLVGATLVAYDTATAREVLNLDTGYDLITFETTGTVERAALEAAVEAALPAGVELVTGAQLVVEQTEEFDGFINNFRTFLLVFAFVILLVSAFVTFNIFTILIGQRVRELGLLRVIGASGRQVTAALLGEALLVGVFATVVGTGLGVGFGWSIRAVLGTLDFGPSGNELIVEPATLAWGAAVGIGVTIASAVAPSMRARRISPMAALREDSRLSRHVPEASVVVGATVTVAAWILVVAGIVSNDWRWIVVCTAAGAVGNAFGVRRLLPTFGRYSTLSLGLAQIFQ